MSRLQTRFDALRAQDRAAFVAFVMGGDPNHERSAALILGLPGAGVDVIEIGMPFTDPMADGGAVQLAGQRALAGGQTMARTFALVRALRARDTETPVVLMGYYNPIFAMGVPAFVAECAAAGVDGLIVVDLPPEEDAELCLPARAAGLDFVRLATPTTDDARLPAVLANTSGFVYYVSITGITGAAAPDPGLVAPEVARIKASTPLPICVGFGVRDAPQAAALARIADGVVVGSAIVTRIAAGDSTDQVLAFVADLATATHAARGVR